MPHVRKMERALLLTSLSYSENKTLLGLRRQRELKNNPSFYLNVSGNHSCNSILTIFHPYRATFLNDM